MSWNLSPVRKAEKLLKVAAAYAGDGAIETAILRSSQAIVVLRKERVRRAKLLRHISDDLVQKGAKS